MNAFIKSYKNDIKNDIKNDLQLVRSDIRSAMTPDPSARIVVSFILL